MSVGSDVVSLTVGCSLSLGQLLFPGLFRKQIRKYAFFFLFFFLLSEAYNSNSDFYIDLIVILFYFSQICIFFSCVKSHFLNISIHWL